MKCYTGLSNLKLDSVFLGKTDITWMMLDAGAETDVVNSVGRTAAQMAAFVGASVCGVVIHKNGSSVLQCLVTNTSDHTLSLSARELTWPLTLVFKKTAKNVIIMILFETLPIPVKLPL